MIVEDNADARDMLRTLLELDGHTVYEASDGAAGLDAILALRPDLAFVDIGLPGVDGFEVARRLRAQENGGPTKLVALTGYGQEADARRTREAGFDLHLIKPIDPDTLASVLAMLATDSM
jgi:two-component system CheB/CheR fusion protein